MTRRPAALLLIAALSTAARIPSTRAADPPAEAWRVGDPIVTYWAGPGFPGGPALDDAAAKQLADGGWNLVWCSEKELDVARRHGLRGLLADPLLDPAALADPKKRDKLDDLIGRVKGHPALYAYHLVDEPPADRFPELGRLVSRLRDRDPARLAYVNLLPIYASNAQLGTKGTQAEAYAEHLRRYVGTVKPALLSYDHYQLTNGGDTPLFFQNLALVRDKAVAAGVPFLNVVQACSWAPGQAASPASPRVPTAEEVRYLVYASLAYGAQGVSYYVYSFPGHEGGFARADGTPTPLYRALKPVNREFVAIARELQPLRSLGVSHSGMRPPGTDPVPEGAAFAFDPPVPAIEYKPGDRVRGALIGRFGPAGSGGAGTHVVVVNPDYKAELTVTLRGPGPLEVFDAGAGKWAAVSGKRAELRLPAGSGKLVRLAKK